MKPTDQNSITKSGQVHLCLVVGNLSFINNYII